MNKKTEVVVKRSWIKDAIACHPKGGCEFHFRKDGSGYFCPGCGCCQLAKAYYDTFNENRVGRLGVSYRVKRGRLFLKTDADRKKFWWGAGGKIAEFDTRERAQVGAYSGGRGGSLVKMLMLCRPQEER